MNDEKTARGPMNYLRHVLLGLLGCVLAYAAYAVWVHAPARSGFPAFVSIGPWESAVHLPMRSFDCSSRGPIDPRPAQKNCSVEFEQRTLRISYHLGTLRAENCSADYAGRRVPCVQGSVSRGYPELALRIEDPLGTTLERRATLRRADPLNHVLECDWILPVYAVTLLCTALVVRRTHRRLREREQSRWVHLFLVSVSGFFAVVITFVSLSIGLLWLGYVD
jgi:hypothetical protein